MIGTKVVNWVGSAKADLERLPGDVQHEFGYALYLAQTGGKHDDAKPLAGFGGAGVLEVVESHAGDTYRAVYTVKLVSAIYVLHVFQKKSKSGIKTPKRDIDLIKSRLRLAEIDDKEREMVETITRGTDNIFADLGFADAASQKLKAELVTRIRMLVSERHLNQTEAGVLIGMSQPEVSRIFKGHFREVSVERLIGMLQRLDCDVDIMVHSVNSHLELGVIHLPARACPQLSQAMAAARWTAARKLRAVLS